MDYFSPGLRELARIAQRAQWRARVWLSSRRLSQAETQLGLLGWQQADFDAETQRQVDAIQHVEREQAGLTNHSALLAREIEVLTTERAAVNAEYEQQRLTLEAERTKAREPLAEIERTLGVLRSRPSDVQQRLVELDREERETEAIYQKLLGVQPQPPSARDEILRLRERLISIPNERGDIRARQLRAAAEIQEREQLRAEIERRSVEFDRRLRDLKAQADERDAGFASQLKNLEGEHARAEAIVQRLERAKLNPYREIGRVLADSRVAPLNQPQALTRVLELRQAILDDRADVDQSLQLTAIEDRQMLQISLTLWGVIALALVFVFGALF